MLKYILGLIKNLFNRGISIFALVDIESNVSKKATVYHGAKIYNSNIDSFSYIGPKSDIICADIGKFCSISSYCCIGLATHSIKNISTSPIFTSKKNGTRYRWAKSVTFVEGKRVSIGNDVWIGTKVIIMGGVKVGNGVIIGAGSIVTKDIPDYAIVVGAPAKIIKFRFDAPIIDRLLELKWWNMSEEKLRSMIPIFQIENFVINDITNI